MTLQHMFCSEHCMRSVALYCMLLSILVGCRRFRGPVAVGELMHFFDATHDSINDIARANTLESASSSRPNKRIKTEVAAASPAAASAPPHNQFSQQEQVNSCTATLESNCGFDVH